MRNRIKVMQPVMPTRAAILRYLSISYDMSWFSNNGPCVTLLEKITGGVTVANATLGLELASKYAFRKNKVRIPAFTFPATATALMRSGFLPVLCDVDDDWKLKNIDQQSLPVCPFGCPVEGPLVDAAGAWGNSIKSDRVYSFHATKTMPAGEGGLVVGSIAESVKRDANFGFGDQVVETVGTNAKMSEFHAATALASLDIFESTSRRRMYMESRYRANLDGVVEFQNRPRGIYAIFPILVGDAQKMQHELFEKYEIETRRWYVPTLEHHPAFAGLPKEGKLKKCAELNKRLLCLPFHLNLTDEEVDYVCERVIECVLRGNGIRPSRVVQNTQVGEHSGQNNGGRELQN